jgi:hypothetical protein
MSRMRSHLLAAVVLGCSAATLFALEGPPSTPAKDKGDEKFIVHEWGTLSTSSGSDGVYRKFYPGETGRG